MLDRRTLIKLLSATTGAAALPPWLTGCGGSARPPRLVILYATCSLNASYLGAYGGPRGLTPELDRLAERAAVLHAHHTEAGQSGVAYASILAGGHADLHGIFDHPTRIDDGVLLITEAFAAAGYESHFWDGHGMASYDLNYGQGVPAEHHHQRVLEAGDEDFRALVEGLARNPERRALVLVNFTATHMKYTANPRLFAPHHYAPSALPEHFAELGLTSAELSANRLLLMDGASGFELCGRFDETLGRWRLDDADRASFVASMEYLYRCSVRRLDQLFGTAMAAVEDAGLLPSSLIAFTADHGETLYRPGTVFKYAHGFQLAPEVLRVPMLLAGPGIAPAHHHFVSRSSDLFPTLAALAAVPLPASGGPVGHDLSATLMGRQSPPELVAYSHTTLVHSNIVNDPAYAGSTLERLYPARDPAYMWVAARHGDLLFKWTRALGHESFRATAFDLAQDPAEDHDLFCADEPRHVAALHELRRYKATLVAAWQRTHHRDPGLEEAERIRRLEALGYL